MKGLFFILTLLSTASLFIGCGNYKQEYDICPTWMGKPTKLTSVELSSMSNIVTKGGYAFTFNPLFLPFGIKWNYDRGLYVEYSNDEKILTPIGSVGLEYSVSTGTTVNGITVKKGDFLVSIIDKKKGEKQLFKIEGYSRLKVILSGETQIDAQSGIVEIDATNSIIKQINFYDNSKAILFNSTAKTVSYKIEVGNQNYNSNTISYKCEIPSKAYVKVPMDDLNGWVDATVFIRVNNDKANNDTYSEQKKKIAYGDFCEIQENLNGELQLIKSTQMERNNAPKH